MCVIRLSRVKWLRSTVTTNEKVRDKRRKSLDVRVTGKKNSHTLRFAKKINFHARFCRRNDHTFVHEYSLPKTVNEKLVKRFRLRFSSITFTVHRPTKLSTVKEGYSGTWENIVKFGDWVGTTRLTIIHTPLALDFSVTFFLFFFIFLLAIKNGMSNYNEQ